MPVFRHPEGRPARVAAETLTFPHGIATALLPAVVTGLAKRVSALGLVVAILATASGSLFASVRHQVCEGEQHDCEQPATISSCCCGDLGAPGNTGTPPQTRVEVVSGLSVATAPSPLEPPVCAGHDDVALHATSPRLVLLDLTTLFACLLI